MKKGKKDFGIDILRIISMLGIISLHILNQGGILVASRNDTLMRIISEAFIITSYCSVNVFAMMSGYLYCVKENVNYKNIVNLILTTAFWSIVITVIHLIWKPQLFDGVRNVCISLFPPMDGRYWYITCYILLFVMIPYMNKVISLFEKKFYEKMLLILFVFLSIIPTVGIFDYFKIQKGYSPFWLMFCYLIGAYIRIYGFDLIRDKKKAIILFIINNLVVLISWEIIKIITNLILGKTILITLLSEYISSFMVINAALLLYIFKGNYCKNEIMNKCISAVAIVAFDVYIVHSHFVIYEYYLEDAFLEITSLPLYGYVICCILIPVLIYLICAICGMVRIGLFASIKKIWITCIGERDINNRKA